MGPSHPPAPDSEAFLRCWEDSVNAIHFLIWLSLKNEHDAEDLTQTVARVALEKWDGREESFLSFARTIARGEINNHLRAKLRRNAGTPTPASLEISEIHGRISSASRRFVRRELLKLLIDMPLTEANHQLLLLKGALGLTHADVAQRLNITEGGQPRALESIASADPRRDRRD